MHILLKQAIEYPNVNLKKNVTKTKILSDIPVLVPYKPLERKRGKETTEHSLMLLVSLLRVRMLRCPHRSFTCASSHFIYIHFLLTFVRI